MVNIPLKIITGFQRGADRASADAALELGIPLSGYVTKGKRAEDGCVPDKYPVIELDTYDYPTRTERNVAESDATLLFTICGLSGGSLLTKNLAIKHNKPWKRINLDLHGNNVAVEIIKEWLSENNFKILNVAGSRESKAPGEVECRVKAILIKALTVESTDKNISGKDQTS